MGTWVTDPATGTQRWQASQYTPSGGPVYAWGDFIDPNNPDLGRYAADIAPQAIQNGLASYDSINIGSDNYFKGNDGYYYKLKGPEANSDGHIVSGNSYDFNTRYTRDNLMGQTMGEWGAIPMTVEPNYNTGNQGMDLGMLAGFFGMAGAGGLLADGLGGLFSGADSGLYGLELGGEGVGAALGGGEAAGGGLYGLELGGEGVGQALNSSTGSLPSFPNFSTLPTDSGMLSGVGGTAYNPATASLSDIISAVTSSGGNAIPASALTPELAAAVASGAPISSLSPSLLSQLASTISNATGVPVTGSQLLGGGAKLLGGLLSGIEGEGEANKYADKTLEAARIAADAAKFRPVGITTRFGSSNFLKDAQGNVVGAGYNIAPDIRGMQDALLDTSQLALKQYQESGNLTAPMGQAAQTMFGLGNSYLSTTPQQQAAKYMADQQALLATGRERDLTSLENRLLSQGRLGLATGGTSTGMMAANPEMEALRNAQKQQDLALAAQATQGGMDYAKFGAGMVSSGGNMLRDQYGTQSAALQPWQTGMNAAQYLEGLGQQPLTLGMDIGRQVTSGSASAGNLLAQGMTNAAQIQQAGSYSPWGTALMNSGNMLSSMTQPQQQAQQAQQQLTQQQMLNPGSFYPTNTTNNMGSEWNWGGLWE